ncbi:MAG: helix-hairpin-helix domain-containing protein [Nitrospirota bacterium]
MLERVKQKKGIALITVLLITALLLALIVEFAYGTRISLQSAVNYRDSRRAYYLAKSGIAYFSQNFETIKKYIPQGEWRIVPMISGGDTEVKLQWEDEAGKIYIKDIGTNPDRRQILDNLLDILSVDTEMIRRIMDNSEFISKISFLSELHAVINDETYKKIYRFITVGNVNKIDINTASAEVLQSLGITSDGAKHIIEERRKNNINAGSIPSLYGIAGTMVPGLNKPATTFLTDTSSFITVIAYTTVGTYSKRIEAVILPGTTTISYWKAL